MKQKQALISFAHKSSWNYQLEQRLLADYREDLLHLVKRADTLADHTKDVARCLEMLWEVDIPDELSAKAVLMTGKLSRHG